jgi:hypothetical protein
MSEEDLWGTMVFDECSFYGCVGCPVELSAVAATGARIIHCACDCHNVSEE